jgi:transposase InsO family protein
MLDISNVRSPAAFFHKACTNMKPKNAGQKTTCNESAQANELKREFQQEEPKKVVVSDLTYVRVQNKWHYICIFVDLFNREIIGFSTGSYKNANLVARDGKYANSLLYGKFKNW